MRGRLPGLLTACGMTLCLAGAAQATVIHDEATDGDLPRSLSFIDYDAVVNDFTFDLNPGSNIVTGSSEFTGAQNEFLVRLDRHMRLMTVGVQWFNPVDRNDHVFDIDRVAVFERSNGTAFLSRQHVEFAVTDMETIGLHEFEIDLSAFVLGEGLYSIFSNTSVSGTRDTQTFALDMRVTSIPSPGALVLSLPAVLMLLASPSNRMRTKDARRTPRKVPTRHDT